MSDKCKYMSTFGYHSTMRIIIADILCEALLQIYININIFMLPCFILETEN